MFSTFEAVKILGIDYTCLNEWLRKYFNPYQKAEGRGTRAKLSLTDLYRLYLFGVLINELKIDRVMAAQIVQKLKDKKEEAWGGFLGFTFGMGGVVLGQHFDGGKIDISGDRDIEIKKDGKIKKTTPMIAQLTVKLMTIKRIVDANLK